MCFKEVPKDLTGGRKGQMKRVRIFAAFLRMKEDIQLLNERKLDWNKKDISKEMMVVSKD